MNTKIWKIVGINFDHMHMGDLLRQVHEHPEADIVGISDKDAERMHLIAELLNIPDERQYTDFRECLETTKPDIALLCPKTSQHADYVEWVAPYDVDILVEKPMAASLADADRMISAMEANGRQLVINWPLAWYPPHITAKRLIDEGVIGDPLEVHYYDGNRGPLRHLADKVEVSAEEAARQKSQSWWYQQPGGGSLQDYLGYGVTLGTWFLAGGAPIDVTCVVDAQTSLEVDEHSITICRYAAGLSRFETRWGTFSDPWTHQPQPKCGFVIVGSEGTISSYDFEATIRLQCQDHPQGIDIPVDVIESPWQNPIQYLIHCLAAGEKVIGPLDPAISRIGQQIVDTAVVSAREKRTFALLK